MGMFQCSKCPYHTSDKRSFNNHMNRKNSCQLSKLNGKIILHGNIKNKDDPYCKLCDKHFARDDSLNRHNKNYHTNINSNNQLSAKKIGDDVINGNKNNQLNAVKIM